MKRSKEFVKRNWAKSRTKMKRIARMSAFINILRNYPLNVSMTRRNEHLSNLYKEPVGQRQMSYDNL